MQLLFPDEMIARLKEVASQEERPVSEVIRRSIEEFFTRYPKGKKKQITVAQLAGHLGEIKVSASELREVLYEEDRL
ncbi:MAG: ribbon-helix-helix protein, CopG family [Chthoniobacterales bacterium]